MELAPPGPEPHDLPSALTGVAGQGRPRVDWMREADRVQERHILVAIGVRVAILKRDSLASGEFFHRGQFAFPPRRTSCYATGEHTMLGLEFCAQDVVDTQ